jgi:hypothetical protein
MQQAITIDIELLYGKAEGRNARIEQLPDYERNALTIAGQGNDITLTGAGPVWLYLRIAHTLHGKVRKLIYSSPVTGELSIYDHNPF